MKLIRFRTAKALLPLVLLGAGPVVANDFPTQERVEYVYQCMQDLGGQNYDTLYKCSCSIDRIAEQVSYDEYLTMRTFERGREAGGERPELIREGRMAGQNRRALDEARTNAAQACGIQQSASSR